MPHAEGLTRLTAPLKLNHQPLRLNPAPATAHCNPSRFTHAISPSQHRYPEKVWLLPRVRMSSASTIKVYGRFSAILTIHISVSSVFFATSRSRQCLRGMRGSF